MKLKQNKIYENRFPLIAMMFAVVIYTGSVKGEFLFWDDFLYVVENTALLSKNGFDFIIWSFTTFYAGSYQPITFLSFGIDYYLWGLNPKGYHMTSVILHGLNTIIVYCVTSKLIELNETKLGKKYEKNIYLIPFITAILFASHTAHVENIAWISSRKDLLFFLFYGLSVLNYLKLIETNNNKNYFLCIVFFCISIISKPMAVSLPITLVAIDIYYKNIENLKEFVNVLKNKVPLILIAIVLSALTIYSQDESSAVTGLEMVREDLISRALNIFGAYFYYIKISIAPFNFAPLHVYETLPKFILINGVLGILTILALLYFSIKKYRTNKFYISATIFFITTLLPIVGVIKVGSQGVAERYFYLTSVMACLVLAIVLYGLIKKTSKEIFIAACIVTMLYFTALTVNYIPTYSTTNALWSRQIDVYGVMSSFAFKRRGDDYFKKGDYGKAIKDYIVAEKYKVKEEPQMYFNMGTAYLLQGKVKQGKAYLVKSIMLKPDFADAHFNLSIVYENEGDKEKAQYHLNKSKKLYKTK